VGLAENLQKSAALGGSQALEVWPMLVTGQPVLRRFWYPVMPVAQLASGPRPFTLLGEDIVLWLDADGAACAVVDRCCHRTARLSRGFVDDGAIVCGYHGWTFDRSGACIRIPQARDPVRKPKFRVEGFRAECRYGYVWVCLGEPLADIPSFEEADDSSYRRIDEFYEIWRCAGLRLMENSFDNAHIAFVHRATFGNVEEPEPASIEVNETAYGLEFKSQVPVVNRDLGRTITATGGDKTVRSIHAKWHLPFTRKLAITYPNGLKHSIVTSATPIDDGSSMIVQFVFRNDTEDQVKAADVIAFDRKVTEEDRAILESTEFDVPLALSSGREFHMPSDKPGLIMRRRFLELLQAHGERETGAGTTMTPGSAAAE
jgi:phenylpropionate dioxygenase-like ring-hydroxylating dioxygenase large terminal subunit